MSSFKPSITPSLWFDHDLEQAATFYTSVFPNSHIEGFNQRTDTGSGEPGTVLSGSFVLDGTRFIDAHRQLLLAGTSSLALC
jgi:predicted 3-demethylubiquinone-9 3-methyltransferase (glyoxalase superfamily)